LTQLNFDLPFFVFIIFIIIAFVLSFFLYRRDEEKSYLSKKTLYLLFFLRWFTFSVLSFFLLGPKFIKSEIVVEKPILVFAQDNSKSIISNSDSIFFRNNYQDSILNKLLPLNEFYDFRTFIFGDKVVADTNFTFTDNSTNFNQLFNFLNNKFHSSNLSDIIIASDGIVNKGKDLPYLSINPSISVNSVILGDTNQYRDLKIKVLKNNKYALLDNNFPIEVSIFSNSKFKNVELTLYSDSKFLQKHEFQNLEVGITKFTFLEKAIKKGFKNYTIQVKSTFKEKNFLNNTKTTFIEVIDYSQKILILTSAAHPDISALNWALEDQLKSKISTFNIDKFDQNINDYDLLIFYKPTVSIQLMDLIKKSRLLEIPSFTVLGNNLPLENIDYLTFGIKENNFKGQNEVSAQLNEDFKSFSLDKDWKNIISEYPPLSVPFSINYKLVSTAKELVSQSVNGLKMNYPLIYFFRSKDIKHGVLLGEGIWRWKMYEYNQTNDVKVFKNFFKKVLQFLKITEKKSRLNITVPKENFVDQSLNIYGEYYNELIEVSNDVDIIFSYSKKGGQNFSKNLIPRNNYYDLSLDGLTIGDYNYVVNVEGLNNKISSSGSFSIVTSQREKMNTVANHQNLLTINQNGSSYSLSNLDVLVNDLILNAVNKNKSHIEEKAKDIINYKWLVLLLIFPFLEWIIRKDKGLL
tara:strand:+ start:674 stop:2743 length:2070 start_codon:yes stop_codon:yes gene_type:complete